MFGIVDTAIGTGHLTAFYIVKGVRNVASMLWEFLQANGWLDKDGPGLELTICANNCTGQNKVSKTGCIEAISFCLVSM